MRIRLSVLALLGSLSLCVSAQAAVFAFDSATRLADGGNFALNDLGFAAITSGGDIVITDGNSMPIPAFTNLDTFQLVDLPRINNQNEVLVNLGQSLSVFRDGQPQVLIESSAEFPGFLAADINDNGDIAFVTNLPSGNNSLARVATDGSIQIVGTLPEELIFLSGIRLNDAGQTLVAGLLSSGSTGLFIIESDGSATEVPAVRPLIDEGFTINNSGDVAFRDVVDGVVILNTFKDGIVSEVTRTVGDVILGESLFINDAAINENGDIGIISQVVRQLDDGQLQSGETAQVFSEGMLSTILAPGDLIDGMIVRTLSALQSDFFNNQVSFLLDIEFENGQSGIYRIDTIAIPLPAALPLFLIGIAGIGAARRGALKTSR